MLVFAIEFRVFWNIIIYHNIIYIYWNSGMNDIRERSFKVVYPTKLEPPNNYDIFLYAPRILDAYAQEGTHRG